MPQSIWHVLFRPVHMKLQCTGALTSVVARVCASSSPSSSSAQLLSASVIALRSSASACTSAATGLPASRSSLISRFTCAGVEGRSSDCKYSTISQRHDEHVPFVLVC